VPGRFGDPGDGDVPGTSASASAASAGADDLMEYQGEGIVVTARREGGVVGVGRAWLSPDGCRAAVVVSREHRNQGVGRHIAAALEAATADAGWGCRFPRTAAEGDDAG
jgi:GNAT superfamily N-acetyltransferase